MGRLYDLTYGNKLDKYKTLRPSSYKKKTCDMYRKIVEVIVATKGEVFKSEDAQELRDVTNSLVGLFARQVDPNNRREK